MFVTHRYSLGGRRTWRSEVFEPTGPVIGQQVVILVSEEPDGTERLHTRGMGKFGRPDISVPGVTAADREGFEELCHRFIEFQALGGIIAEGQEIRMGSLPDGYACHHAGDLDDPDFNNVHIRVVRGERASSSPC